MTEQREHWKKLFNPAYLGEYEFKPGEEKIVTVKSIGDQEITGTGGKKENKPVMMFDEPIKPLILNTVNCKMMTKLFKSPIYADWIGKQITLYGDPSVTFGKETVGGVRIKKDLPQSSVCADCGQIIGASGKFTAKQIAQSTINTYGRALCMDCAKEAKQARDNNKGEETNA